jgi:hypothetical protein
MQAIAPEPAAATDAATGLTGHQAPRMSEAGLAGDLYAVVTHLHKNCTGDLLEALGLLDLNLSQSKLLHRLETAGREL